MRVEHSVNGKRSRIDTHIVAKGHRIHQAQLQKTKKRSVVHNTHEVMSMIVELSRKVKKSRSEGGTGTALSAFLTGKSYDEMSPRKGRSNEQLHITRCQLHIM